MSNYVAVIGSGGTGSYLVEPLLMYYNGLESETKVKLIDGDVLEERNLERQAFFIDEVGMSKSLAIVERLQDRLEQQVILEGIHDFINNARVFVDLLEEDKVKLEDLESFVIISCVDNMYARLRMTLGLHVLHRYLQSNNVKARVSYIDSGNAEHTGQTITSTLDTTKVLGNEELNDFLDSVIDNKAFINKLKRAIRTYEPLNEENLNTIFTGIEDWENNLTKADHEISCDEMAESAPQNILVNQMASVSILNNLNIVNREGRIDGYTSFNTKNFDVGKRSYGEDESYSQFFKELLEFTLTEEGKEVLMGTKAFVGI